MPEEKQGGASEIISKGASAAKTIQGAVKTGKAIAGIAKGAAAGGPYGAVAMGLWQNRKLVVKIILAAAFIMLLPILFILMLPALIFGGLNTDSPDIPVMNDNTAIYANIDDARGKINAVLVATHDATVKQVDDAIGRLASTAEHETADNYSGFDATALICQYQAYKDDYNTLAVDDLIRIINDHKDKLFSYSVKYETREVKTSKTVEKIITEYVDSVVTDAKGNKTTVKTPVKRKVEEVVEEVTTVTKYFYAINFVGPDYFADQVFHLTPEKKAYAKDLGDNLAVFLKDRN